MERMTVVGRKKVDFTPKGQQEAIVGCNLYCLHSDPNADGYVSEKIFFNSRSELYASALELTVPIDVVFNFNRYGKPESFTVVAKENQETKK